jgi:hypothetical protein
VGALPPGGLLLIWAWAEMTASDASAATDKLRGMRFMVFFWFVDGWDKPRIVNMDEAGAVWQDGLAAFG